MAQRLAFASALLFAALLAVPQSALADRIFTRNSDRVIEGKIIREDENEVEIQKKYGSIVVSRDNIDRIEYELQPEEVLAEAVENAKTAGACVAAAKVAESEGVEAGDIKKAYQRALQLDTDDVDARAALGFVKHEGEWLTEGEANKAKGLIKYDGEWIKPEQIEAKKEERRQRARERFKDDQKALQGKPWGAAHKIESDNYIIMCNAPEHLAKGYSQFMEKLYTAYDKVFGKFKRHHTGKSTIYIFRNIGDFQEYGGGQPGVGGFYRPKSPAVNLYPDRIVSAYHGTFGATGSTREVLAHEGTHQFQHLICAGSARKFLMRPMWFVEGLAVYFGDGYAFDKKGNLEIGLPRDRVQAIQGLIKSGHAPPLKQLIRMPQRVFNGFHYAPAWSLCYYFMHRGRVVKGKGKKAKVTYKKVDIGGKSVDLNKIFEDFFKFVTEEPPESGLRTGYEQHYSQKLEQLLGFPIETLEADWKSFILGLELDPLGTVSKNGKTFTSELMAFEIGLPSGWEWKNENLGGAELVRLENPTTSARVTIVVEGNMDNEGPSALRHKAEQSAGSRLESPYIEESKEAELDGYPGFEVIYEGKEFQPANASRQIQVRDAKQRFRHVVIATVKRSYGVVMQCDKDRFEENQDAFEDILSRCRILRGEE
ncbi:MAG: hypothetical protein ACYTFT_07400 [Planctomycetota bacterium]|jgi:hypothetical protein